MLTNLLLLLSLYYNKLLTMKTFTELEEIGIVGMFTEGGSLYIITKDRRTWKYNKNIQAFTYQHDIL